MSIEQSPDAASQKNVLPDHEIMSRRSQLIIRWMRLLGSDVKSAVKIRHFVGKPMSQEVATHSFGTSVVDEYERSLVE